MKMVTSKMKADTPPLKRKENSIVFLGGVIDGKRGLSVSIKKNESDMFMSRKV